MYFVQDNSHKAGRNKHCYAAKGKIPVGKYGNYKSYDHTKHTVYIYTVLIPGVYRGQEPIGKKRRHSNQVDQEILWQKGRPGS